MDRQQREYHAILEQVTREASLQAELDLRARAQAEAGRNYSASILNRLDIQARLGSRVAPIEEPTRQLHSRVTHGSPGLRQQLPVRSQPLLQPYLHPEQPEHGLSGYGSLLTRANNPLPLMVDDPRGVHNFRTSLRNHSPVQHGSFTDDFYLQENFQPELDHPSHPVINHPSDIQQRMAPEIHQERRTLSQGSSAYQKPNRSLIRPPISSVRQPIPQKNQGSPPASRLAGSLHVNASSRSSSNSPGSSVNKKGNIIGESDLNRKKVFLQARDMPVHSGKTPVKADTKSATLVPTKAPPVIRKTLSGGRVEKENKKESPVESKPKAKATSPNEKKVPSLFGPPPSAPAYKDADKKSNDSTKSTATIGSRSNPVEIVESLPPKPLMDFTPSLSALPFSNTTFSESNLQSGSATVSTVKFNKGKSSGTQSPPSKPPEPHLNTGKPVPLLDITPVPLFDIKPVSFNSKNTSQSPNAKRKSPVSLLRSSSADKCKASESKLLEDKSKHTVNKEENKESPLHHPSSKEAAKEKSNAQKEAINLSVSSHTEEIIDLEESHDIARPLWYTSPDSLDLQSADTADALTGDIEQNCASNEVEEGEIIGESCSDEMETTETKYHKTDDLVVVMPPEITGETSSIILRRFYAAPEEFIHFLPFPEEASEENIKSVEKCWQQLLILRSFTTKQRRPCSQKILSRIKSHFAQGKIKPTNSLTQFCFKVWSHIATYLGGYLHQRLDNFVRGLVHRSMIDFILIHMHKKKMPRSLKNASVKAQINLLYIFSLQGFTNATNNYMVKWLLDELEKVGIRVNVNTPNVISHTKLDMKPSIASAHLNGLVLDDQLVEKKFCLVEYLKVKSFSDPKEEEQCVRFCTLLKCQDYIPNTEWKYDKAKSSPASKPLDNSMSKSTAAEQKGLITDVAKSKEVKPVPEVSDKTNKSIVPKSQEVFNESSDQVGLQRAASKSGGVSEVEKKASVPSTPSSREKNDEGDSKHGGAVDVEHKKTNIQEPMTTVSPASGTNQVEKTDSSENIHIADNNKENVSIIIPEIEVTPAKASEVSSNNSIEKQRHPLSHEPLSKKKGGHSRKLYSDTAGKWRSYMVEGNSSSSRIVSRRRRQEMVHHGRKHLSRHRTHSSSIGKSQSSNRSSSSERSQHSDGNNKAVDSDSDSEDLEEMILRKKALQSMLNASVTKKGGSNSDSKVQAKEEDKLAEKPQQTSLDPPAGKLAVEQISDNEGNVSPKAYSIAESGVVLVSLGTDNVVSFPSQYNTTASVADTDKPLHSKKAKDDHKVPVEKQNDTAGERMEVSPVTAELKPSEEETRTSSEAVAAYYKVSTGNSDQKQAEKGKQSFVIRVTSEDSDSDETDVDRTAPHSTVTSGTSSPMPIQQENSSPPTRKDLEDLIQLYKRRAKEKEVAPVKNDQGALKSPDAIKIMPRPKQDEYHLLKEQIAQLEKKKKERKTANKRKPTAPPENQAKRFKPYITNKEETSGNLQQQTEAVEPKKEVEYQTNIAVCEVQLEELKVTIDRGYSDVMKLNKQLNDCVSEIEEHTMKLQLLNKQLKIAKDSLELAQGRQQEIKNKVKAAQNSLLKDKSSLAVVEGELAHFHSQLAKLQKQLQQKPTPLLKDNQVTVSQVDSPLKVKEKKSDVVDVNAISDEPKADNSSTDHQSALPSDNVQNTPSGVVNVLSSACTTIKIASVISECIDSPLSLGTKLPSRTTKEAKIKPGQKIANVVKKLSQEHHVHTSNPPSTAAPKNEEMSCQVEDKSIRKSLDAVVAKLHIVKKNEFDKQFQVDLGSVKQARENTKLDSVVEKLVAKRSQSQLSCDYPVRFEAVPNKSADIMDASVHCMEADVSSTVPDIFDDSKIDMQRKSTVMKPSNIKNSFHSIAGKDTDKPVIMFGNVDGGQEKKRGESVISSVKQGIQMKLASGPKIVKVETAHLDTNSGVQSGVIQLRSKDQADTKEGNTATNLLNIPTKLSVGVPVAFDEPSPQHKQMLAKVNKFIIETFNVKPKVLECLPGSDDSQDTLNDSMCGSLTDFYAMNSTVSVQQESSVPDSTFVKLFQPIQEPLTVSSSAASSFSAYRSPLSCFKSYRLHPYYRTRAKLAVSSSTYSNKISPDKIMCKFNMTGKCSDKNCIWQHWNETQMNSNELFSDVVSYAPDLAMVVSDDDVATAQSKISAHTTSVVSSLGKRMTTDEIGVYLVDQVVNSCDSRTFNARIEGRIPMKSSSGANSSAAIQRPKSFTSDFKAVFDTTYSQLGTLGQTPSRNSSKQSDRYFGQPMQASSEVDSSCDPKAVVLSVRESIVKEQNEDTESVHKSAVTLLEAALRTNPHEEELWVELMRIHARNFGKVPVDQLSLCLFLTACHKAIKTTESYSILQECISLLPTYEVKSKWYIKGYDMVKLKEDGKEKSVQCLELFLGSVVLDYMTGYTVEAIEKMKFSLRLKECHAHYPFKDLLDYLTCDDLLLFWMVYIYYCHSHAFPSCVIETTASGCRILDKKTFIIHWKEGERLSALYNNFIQLFKMALKHCKTVYTVKYPQHTSAVYALQFQNLFENLILLEYKCGNLEAAKISIRKVLSVHPSYLGMWLLLADVVVKCGYTEGYKEVYVEAENMLRGNIEFYYIVARKLHQQGDSNEAISWLTSCVCSKYTGKCLNATEYDVILHYRKLLRQPVPYHYQTSTIVSESDTHHIPYLWLSYCLYVELAGAPNNDSEYWPTTEEAYEAAVHSVHSPEGVKLVWKAYLMYLMSTATSRGAEVSDWKQFLDCINRAFGVVDPKDHEFQTEVVDMCMAALPAAHDDKALGLYNHWIRMFPYNKALVCRCSDAAIKLNHIEMAQNVLATYLTDHPKDWNTWKKAIDIEVKLDNIKEVRWMYWEASKSSLFNIFFWKEFLKFELRQSIATEDTHQVTAVLQQCNNLGINLTKLVS